MFYFTSVVFLLTFHICTSLPEQGVWNFDISEENNFVAVSKVAYKNSKLQIRVICEADNPVNVSISFVMWLLPCYQRGLQFESKRDLDEMRKHHGDPSGFHMSTMPEKSSFFYLQAPPSSYSCTKHSVFPLEPVQPDFIKYTPPLPLTTVTFKAVTKIDESEKNPTSKKVPSDSTKDTTENQKEDKPKSKRETSVKTEEKSKAEPAKIPETTISGSTTAKPTINPVTSTTVKPDAHTSGDQPQLALPADGVYILTVLIQPDGMEPAKFKGSIEIKIPGESGYLSAIDWPLLPFYGVMCVVYVMYGLVWLLVSACQWRDLLRVQFWIGGVLFLGMLEMAVFYAEFQSINSTGRSVKGAVIAAEVVSCLKRTLARMVVIIVSLGFGIVKPRLGSLLHRVVGVGAVYFILSVAEGIMRVYGIKDDKYRQFWIATIFLAVLDSFICWWIFTSLVQTTRTLRLRRNVVKLSLYRHFTNTLIFAVIASVAFMVWSLKAHQKDMCIEDWEELWVDEAYWRFLFSMILLVIMILWRPTNNNQRYAFTPLLDAADDEDEEQNVPESFEGMKMRGVKNQNHNSTKGVEDDLKWIDENIPSALSDVALPSLLDSDEEIMTTKFEISKMN